MIKLNNIEFLEIEGNKLTARGVESLEFFEGLFFNEKSVLPIIDISPIEKVERKTPETFPEEAPPEEKKKREKTGGKHRVSEDLIKNNLLNYFKETGNGNLIEFPLSRGKHVSKERNDMALQNLKIAGCGNENRVRKILEELVADNLLKKEVYKKKVFFTYMGELAHPEEVGLENEKELRECKLCKSFFIPVGVENACKDCLTRRLTVARDKVKTAHEKYLENREKAKAIQRTIEWKEEIMKKQSETEEIKKPEEGKEPDLQTVKAILLSYFKKFYPARHWIPEDFSNLQKPEEKNRAEEVFDITGTENPELIHQAMSELLDEKKLIIGGFHSNRNFYCYQEVK